MRRHLSLLALIVLLAAFTAGCGLFNRGVEVPEEPLTGTLVFQSNRADGKWQIFKMELPDGEPVQLTFEGQNFQPRISPDGTKVVFDTDRDGGRTIYVMDIDGSNQRRISPLGGDARNATWSPDGEYVAFHARASEGGWAVFTVKADGTELKQLTHSGYTDAWVSWHPNGEIIAFSSNRPPHNPNYQTYVINVDGTGERQLTSWPNRTQRPAWSPDGKSMAVGSNRDGQWEIYIDSADGKTQRRLTNSDVVKLEPAWSPDGKWVAFSGEHDGGQHYTIWVVRSDGKGLRQLDVGPGSNRYPSWGK